MGDPTAQRGERKMKNRKSEIEKRIKALENQCRMIYFNRMGSREWELLDKCEKELKELETELKEVES